MSAPSGDGNPWLTLVDVLNDDIPVATIATVIEKFGVQTYDRFGRRIPATEGTPDERTSKDRALNILEAYYNYLAGPDDDMTLDPDRWTDPESPLNEFGWPKDEAPNFKEIAFEGVPEPAKPKGSSIDAALATRTRRTYLTIIASLCNKCGINYEERGAPQRIKELTEKLGYPVDDGTIQTVLKDIPEALEARSK